MAHSDPALTRRDFVRTAGATAALGSLALAAPSIVGAQDPVRRRYAIVGTGVRGCGMWGTALVKAYADVLELVGLCDVNRKRVEVAQRRLDVNCPTFARFDEMCDKTRPDLLAVTTVDAHHAEYIVRALDRGIDVIVEKPMVIDERQCQEVLDAERRNRRKIVVAFNYRYAPKHQKIKEILLSADLGRVISVDLSWYLDVYHGADYFRRWHRLKAAGGSLLVHKATHHFDLVNWWLDADPVEVVADGDLQHYGKKGPFRHTHCRPCPHRRECRYFWDITKDPWLTELYTRCEAEDGYLRDGCVYREDVDIWDTMAAMVRYSNGVLMNYSLNAFMPFEGYRLAVNCDRGRLEVRDHDRQPWKAGEATEVHVTRSFGRREKVDVPRGQGDHDGGDARLRELIFRRVDVPGYLRLPGSRAGAMSCLTGIAARKSIEERRAIRIADLVRF